MIRDDRWKIWVNPDRKGEELYDLANDPFEAENLIASDDPDAVEARERLMRIVQSLPEQDAAPCYRPMPPQPWGRESGWVDDLADEEFRRQLNERTGQAP